MFQSVSKNIPQQEIVAPRMVSSYNSPPRKGRSAKTRANRSLSEDSEEDLVEMMDIKEFPETLLLDPTSPPRKLSMRSKVILKMFNF